LHFFTQLTGLDVPLLQIQIDCYKADFSTDITLKCVWYFSMGTRFETFREKEIQVMYFWVVVFLTPSSGWRWR